MLNITNIMAMIIGLTIIPLSMIVVGHRMWKNPPEKVNDWYGYRTPTSTRNDTEYKFANQFFGMRWFYLGCILLATTIMVGYTCYMISDAAIKKYESAMVFIQVAVMLMPIVPTEKVLKKRRDKEKEM